jgi:CheY-like chemotaxis protein
MKRCDCVDSVLIVDDNMFNLMPLETMLEEYFEIKVDKAMNGREAVE